MLGNLRARNKMRVAQAPRLLCPACRRGACATKAYLSHRVSAHFVTRSTNEEEVVNETIDVIPGGVLAAGSGKRAGAAVPQQTDARGDSMAAGGFQRRGRPYRAAESRGEPGPAIRDRQSRRRGGIDRRGRGGEGAPRPVHPEGGVAFALRTS